VPPLQVDMLQTLTHRMSAGLVHVWMNAGQVEQAAMHEDVEVQLASPPQPVLHELTHVRFAEQAKVVPVHVAQLGMQLPATVQKYIPVGQRQAPPVQTWPSRHVAHAAPPVPHAE
jgi:hypothetical protein